MSYLKNSIINLEKHTITTSIIYEPDVIPHARTRHNIQARRDDDALITQSLQLPVQVLSLLRHIRLLRPQLLLNTQYSWLVTLNAL